MSDETKWPQFAKDVLSGDKARIESHLPDYLRDVTWKCHVCGATRPDDKISVYSRTKMIGRVEMQENVRYCNDNPECITGAMDVHFVKEDR